MRVAVIIPALNEGDAIAEVIARVPAQVEWVIVVDGGSTDATVQRARAAGALVIVEAERGYGRACAAGCATALALGADVLAFADGALCEDPAELQRILDPIRAGLVDFVLGSRTRGRLVAGALAPWQRAGNAVVCALMAARWGAQYSDLGPMRAITSVAFRRLRMCEPAHGWPAEMQVKAARLGLRVREIPVTYRPRQTGHSKVSGSLVGAARAGVALLRVAAWGARTPAAPEGLPT